MRVCDIDQATRWCGYAAIVVTSLRLGIDPGVLAAALYAWISLVVAVWFSRD